MVIDLRSDTVTKPTPAMLEAMMKAPIGDDVFEEDPSVQSLEQKAAEMFGKEAGLYCPSGTMTNQIAIKMHTQPLDEVICHELAHIYQYEVGGIAFHSGASVRLVPGDRGLMTADDVRKRLLPENVHFPITRLVAIENTTNKGGGACYDLEDIKAIAAVCKEHGLAFHIDGARIFNALVAKNETPVQHGQYFDSISVCLSKGLGAPVGSVLLGTKSFIKSARRIRKVMGGGMRQAGILAAAGSYALDHHVDRLADDHRRAKALEQALEKNTSVEKILPVETNIVIFQLLEGVSTAGYLEKLSQANIKAISMGPQLIRFVTHLDFTDEMLEKVLEVLSNLKL
jgi:threonine aldolase